MNTYNPGALSLQRVPPVPMLGGGYKGVEGVGPSQQEKSPEVTGKQDVGNILDYTISVTSWGEEKVWDAGKET